MKAITGCLIFVLFLFSTGIEARAQAYETLEANSRHYLFGYCLDSEGAIVPNCYLYVGLSIDSNNTYTNHVNHIGTAPTTELACPDPPVTGQTCNLSVDSYGYSIDGFYPAYTGLRFDVITPNVTDWEYLSVCADNCANYFVWVGHHLVATTLNASSSDYALVGATTFHPINHYGTEDTIGRVAGIAADYKNLFQNETWFNPESDWVVGVNDISIGGVGPLEFGGGMFDEGNHAWWVENSPGNGHVSHQLGKNVDFRASHSGCHTNSIPTETEHPGVRTAFIDIAHDTYSAVVPPPENAGLCTEHLHLTWN